VEVGGRLGRERPSGGQVEGQELPRVPAAGLALRGAVDRVEVLD
jgi:hypothetical protein